MVHDRFERCQFQTNPTRPTRSFRFLSGQGRSLGGRCSSDHLSIMFKPEAIGKAHNLAESPFFCQPGRIREFLAARGGLTMSSFRDPAPTSSDVPAVVVRAWCPTRWPSPRPKLYCQNKALLGANGGSTPPRRLAGWPSPCIARPARPGRGRAILRAASIRDRPVHIRVSSSLTTNGWRERPMPAIAGRAER